jgi:hypothetical protein
MSNDNVINSLEHALRFMIKKYKARTIKPMLNKYDKRWYGKTGGYYIAIGNTKYVIRFRKNLFRSFSKYYPNCPIKSEGCGFNKMEILSHIRDDIFCIEILSDGRILLIHPQDISDFVFEYDTFKKNPDMDDVIYNIPISIMVDFNEYIQNKQYNSWKERRNELTEEAW